MFKVLQHLLPNGRAWRTTTDKALRRYIAGLGAAADDARDAIGQTYLELLPQHTGSLDEWDDQFGLPPTALLEQERRNRLDAAWKAQGGQSPRYIQDTLQAAGFNVYIHEWWDPPVAAYVVECGEPTAECGEPTAECGALITYVIPPSPTARSPFDVLSDGLTFTGYYLSCGAASAVCGGGQAICGAAGVATGRLLVNKVPGVVYNIPIDPADWPYILYFGGEEYGQRAQIPLARQDEFEALCLKICPLQQWIGLIVEYN